MVRTLFFVCLIIWLGGGAIGYSSRDPLIRDISINIFGSLTIILGLVWIGIAIGKRGKATGSQPPPQPQAQAQRTAPPAPPTVPPVTAAPAAAAVKPSPNQLRDDEILAKWSGWVRRGESKMIMEYQFQGVHVGDGTSKVQIIINVQRGSFALLRLTNLMVVPQIATEAGYLVIVLRSLSSDASTGFMSVNTMPVPGNATLLNVVDRENADKVFRLLMLGEEMDFTVWSDNEPVLRLPLHNDEGFAALYTVIEKELRR